MDLQTGDASQKQSLFGKTMFLSRFNLIYIHPQKTAGNSISGLLLPFSDDEKRLRNHQDGIDRFNIVGEMTARKHADLTSYMQKLSIEEVARMQVAVSVRSPLDRAISWYFSPNRWYRPTSNGWSAISPVVSIDEFIHLIPQLPRITDILTINGVLRQPDFILRLEKLREDFHAMVISLALPIDCSSLPHVNTSVASPSMRQHMRNDPRVRDAVMKRFAADFELFDYEMDKTDQ